MPINLNSDGCFKFSVKINVELNERERRYVLAKSDEYLLKTEGTVILSGIEHIEKNVSVEDSIKVSLDKGSYSIIVYLIEWDAEPKMRLKNGNPAPNALPDFIVSIQLTNDESRTYRKSIETFNAQD